ncbi:anti-sigma factor family protein [Burkholderia oklahomensis]|uniref:anti-sigma factor family protein n=3 Tax=Burkholderia oklahomensis TaxID=342113 RepID=UPI0005D99FD5|nr:zf-HC2 domain-containing protein [Burkholderia oklahomensis]AJX30630.1 zinc-finger family protein [Burkholderia oklahomensis C6786]AOI45777.1 anti-sigma factor [Burkholderia oklahomensis C6786]KUY51223.1 anti-sigma factor [Burkholderia oklahomensis C6786]MBI0361690.1 anti-sigma factor [Burkholderia oklahomensis]SUW55904.1 Predicted transmembrane transcriptional regulator (anti-sigma factor) [Burkholderia oklahomensis]
MDCNETRALLDADVDRELSAPDALRVERHVDGCDACRVERDRLVALGRAVRRAEYHRASDALRARIVAGLPVPDVPVPDVPAPDGGPPAARAWRWFGRPGPRGTHAGLAVRWPRPRAAALPGLGWGVALAIALAAAAGLAVGTRRAATERIVDEIVASHVRAGLSSRDIDVISTDRHTVKPWFNGRLDYAPPVVDLSASGFALAGGRLDYVGQRRVAVLVYRYRQHVIDVYVRPSGEGGAAPYATVSQGYALDRWDAAGMTWWAVTDAEPSALAAFRTALTARVAAPRAE